MPRQKHIEFRHPFCERESIGKNLEIRYLPSCDQIVDGLIKVWPQHVFIFSQANLVWLHHPRV